MTTSLHDDVNDFFSHNVERKKTGPQKKKILYNSISIKFMKKQNKVMVLEVRIVVTSGKKIITRMAHREEILRCLIWWYCPAGFIL